MALTDAFDQLEREEPERVQQPMPGEPSQLNNAFALLEAEEEERRDPTGWNYWRELMKRPVAGTIGIYKGLAQSVRYKSEPFAKVDPRAYMRVWAAKKAEERADKLLKDPWLQEPEAWREPVELKEVFGDMQGEAWKKAIEEGDHPALAQAKGIKESVGKHAPRIAAATAEAAPSLALAFGLSYLTKSNLIGAWALGQAESGPMMERATEAGVDPYVVAAMGTVSEAVITALEFLPLETLTRYGGKSRIIAAIRQGGAEGGQEWAQTIFQNLVEHYGWDKAHEITEGLFESTMAGFLLGAPAGVIAPEATTLRQEFEELERKAREGEVIELTEEMEEPAIELEEPAFEPHPERSVTDPGLYVRSRTESPVFDSFRGASMNLEKAAKDLGREHQIVQIVGPEGERVGWGLWAESPAVPEPEAAPPVVPPTIEEEIEGLTPEGIDDILGPPGISPGDIVTDISVVPEGGGEPVPVFPPGPPEGVEVPPEGPEPTPELDIGTPGAPNVRVMSEVFLQRMREGEEGLNKVRLQQIVAERMGIPRSELLRDEEFLHKPIEEAFEYALVKRTREIISAIQGDYPGMSANVYEQLKRLYQNQPRLATRTGLSTKNQQYSTPLHLGYLMQVMTAVDPSTSVYEPTAGTGMLLTKTNPGMITANEIEGSRVEILRDQEIVTYDEDGRTFVKNRPGFDGSHDVVLANPPFGTQLAKYVESSLNESYRIMKLEHEIVMDALKAMKNDGKAAFLVGEHNVKGKNNEPTQARKNFLNWLYSHYNVVLNAEIPGSEYARQGTQFDVTLFVVHGRKASHDSLSGWWHAVPFTLRDASVDNIAAIAEGVARGEKYRPADILAPEGVAEVPPSGEVVGPVGPEGVEGVEEELPPAAPPEGVRPPAEAEPTERPPTIAGEPTAEPVPGPIPPGVEAEPVGPVGEPGVRPPRIPETPPTVPPIPEQEVVPEPVEEEPGPPERPITPEPEPVEVEAPEIEPVGVPGVESPIEQDIAGITSDGLDDLFGEPDGKPEIPLDPAAEETPPDRTEEANEVLKGNEARQAWDEYFDQVGTLWTGRPDPETKLPKEAPKKAAKEHLLDAISEAGKAGKEAIKGLDALFGGKEPGRVSMGFTFDEETYAQAKPHFEAALDHAKQMGQSMKEMVGALIEKYGDTIKPYLRRWLEEAHERTKRQKLMEDEYQVTYIPKSRGQLVDETMMPRKQREAVNQALDALEERVGDIDEFVARQLRFDTVEELWDRANGESRFSADQVDALALALDNMINGKATIIGDATGVGKGRVAAAIMDWARWHGKIPIFFTEKANLFTDIYRDFVDIGRDFNPFIMGDRAKGVIYDADGKAKYHPLPDLRRRNLMNEIANEGTGALAAEGFDVVLTNYSQVNHPSRIQQRVIEKIAPGNILVLDEAHNAAGESNTGDFMRNILQKVEGVVYLSATFAKRPDTLSLYRKTDIGKANMTHEELVEALKRGGTALQEILSTAWTKLGQYIRREKSFRGISMPVKEDLKNAKRDQKRSDTMTKHLRMMVKYDKDMAKLFAKWNKDIKQALRKGGGNWRAYIRYEKLIEFLDTLGIRPEMDIQGERRVSTSVSKTDFGAKVHNAIRQLLFTMKSQFALEEAKAALKAGQKPLIAVSNTMETFVEDMVMDGEIKIGDAFDMTYSDSLRIHLKRMLSIRVTDTKGNNETVKFPVDLLPVDFANRYNRLLENIADTLTDMPLSPIDWLRKELAKVDVTDLQGNTRKAIVGEITGRTFVADIENPDNPVLTTRSEAEKAGRNQIIRDYNMGDLDVLITNAAGASGLSAHASSKFKDQRQRYYMGVQAELDVAVEVQKMGRINRKGQVVIPAYVQLISALPAEIRPMAVLMRKLKSLSANTSANADSVLMTKEIPDMMNKYGDRVVLEYLINNEEFAKKIGMKIAKKEDLDQIAVTGLMGKVTGKVALLSVKDQQSFYEEIESEYNELIQDLKDEGTYDLEVDDMDFRAETIDKELLIKGTDEENPFGESTWLEKLKVKALKKPYRQNQLVQFVYNKAGKTKWKGKYDADEMSAFIDTEGSKYVQDTAASIMVAAQKYMEKKRKEAQEAEEEFPEREYKDKIDSLAAELAGQKLGKSVWLTFAGGAKLKGILIDVTHSGGAGNPAAPSKTKFVYAVNSPLQRYILPLSRLGVGERAVRVTPVRGFRDPKDMGWWDEWNDLIPTEATEERHMITGNLLQGFTKAPQSSKVVRFTDKKEDLREGILTPATFDQGTDEKTARVTVTSEQAVQLAKNNKPLRGKVVKVLGSYGTIGDHTRIQIRIDSRKKQGSPYYQDDLLRELILADDFEKRGKEMRAQVLFSDLHTFLNRVYEIGDRFTVDRSVFKKIFEPKEEEKAEVIELKDEVTAEQAQLYFEQDAIATWDAAQGITQPEVVTAPDIARRGDIIRSISKRLNVPIKAGKYRGRKILGLWKFGYGDKVIRIKRANDFPTVIHEVGHDIEQLLYPGNIKHPAEVRQLAYPGASNKSREGFAEFLRYYVTTPAFALESAPMFFKDFEDQLQKYPDVQEVIVMARQTWEAWKTLTPVQKVDSILHNRPEKTIETPTLNQIYTHLVDKIYPISLLTQRYAKMKGAMPKPTEDPYIIAWLNRGWARIAEQFLRYGTFRYDPADGTKFTGPSYIDILRDIEKSGKRRLFDIYLIAQRAQADQRILRGFQPDFQLSDWVAITNEYRGEFELAAAQLYEYSDQLMEFLVDSQRISREVKEKISDKNLFYAPFYRVMDFDTGSPISKSKFGNVPNPIYTLRGSSRDVYSPTESLIYNTYAIINAAQRNKVGVAIHKMTHEYGLGDMLKVYAPEGMGELAERVSFKIKPIKMTTEEALRSLAKNLGIPFKQLKEEMEKQFGLDENDLEMLVRTFRPLYRAGPNEAIFYINGKPLLFEMRQDIYKAIMATDEESLSTAAKIFGLPAKMLRIGATAAPEFATRNPERDTWTAWLYSRYKWGPHQQIYDIVKGVFSILGKDEMYQKFNASGAAHAALVSLDRNYITKDAKILLEGKTVKNLLKHPIDTLQMLSELTEEASRVGEFIRAYKAEGGDINALFTAGHAARDITLDFQRIGAKTKGANILIAFWNARVQGADKMAREIKNRPANFFLKGFIGMTIPTLLLWWAQRDDPYYDEIPEWRKALFWNIITHNPDGSLNHIWSIPKPFEAGIFFATFFEELAEWYYKNDPEGVVNAMEAMWEAIWPGMIPTFTVPIIEWFGNKSLFFQRPIVPRGTEDLEPLLQYNPYTSETAKLIGRAMDKIPYVKKYAAPGHIENFIRAWTGGLGGHGLERLDNLLDYLKIADRPIKPYSDFTDWPVLRGWRQRMPSAQARSINRFYERYLDRKKKWESKKARAGVRGWGLKIKRPPELVVDEKVAKQLSFLRKVVELAWKDPNMDELQKRKAIDAIYIDMINLARRRMGRSPLYLGIDKAAPERGK